MYYFDNHATTQVDSEILELFQKLESDISISNPHSKEHYFGWKAEGVVNDSLDILADNLNCLPSELIFTSGATEANNLAVIGIATAAHLKKVEKRKIVISSIEHDSIRNSAFQAARLFGYQVLEVPVLNTGEIDLKILANILDDEVLIFSCMAVNNEIGVVQPIAQISEMCRAQNIIFHVDGAQAAYLNIEEIVQDVDCLSLSGHKIYAPKGVGLLYISSSISIVPEPLILGGGQQGGIRSGTLSPALCFSFAKALEKIVNNREKEISKLKSMVKKFCKRLSQNNISYKINGHVEHRHPGNLNIVFENIDADTLILRLQPKIAISTGSACHSQVMKKSHVLESLGLSEAEINSSIRIGFGRFNTVAESIELADIISYEIFKLRGINLDLM